MNRFYMLLGVVAVLGGGALFFASREKPAAGLTWGGPAPAPAADGFNGYTTGSDSAPVEVVEYLDFECPACAQFAAVQMPTIREQLIATGKVRWRSRDFPLQIHQYSRFAAHAAQCAGEQGKFWEMHDQLFFNNHSWAQTGKNPSRLFRGFAETAGADGAKYDACMKSERYAGRIQASLEEGERVGVAATPTFFVNGRPYQGRSNSDGFKALVDSLTARR
ncbi:MAG: DsbA family protein [Gemmatimonadetes bacterium]|nr:DsbA family protein [Gemmatimonadota bacterium]